MTTDTANALVIGGTGMLADATRWLAARSRTTLLVSRRASQFATAAESVRPIDADWNQPDFPVTVQDAMQEIAPIGQALLWLHEADPVLTWLLPPLADARVVLVLGSRDGQPRLTANTPNVASVRLGSVRTAQGRRWLTHKEISRAAIQALRTGEACVAGELLPVLP